MSLPKWAWLLNLSIEETHAHGLDVTEQFYTAQAQYPPAGIETWDIESDACIVNRDYKTACRTEGLLLRLSLNAVPFAAGGHTALCSGAACSAVS